MKDTLLIVDDSPVNRKALCNIFSDNYYTIEACDGQDALYKLELHPEIALIILDIVMPNMDGYEFLKYLGSRDELKRYPVICKTAYTDRVTIQKVLELGAVDCIFSPYNDTLTKLRVKNVLRTQKYLLREFEAERNDTNTIFKNLTRNLPGAFAVYQIVDNRVIRLTPNDQLAKLSGYPETEYEELVRNDTSVMIFSEDLPKFRAALSDAVKTGSGFSVAYRLNHRDGSHPWVHLLATPIKQHTEQKLFHAFILDIDESKQKEEQYKYFAEHDQLTGIYNSRAFYELVPEFLKARPKEQWVILRYNIMKFRLINELYGFEFGNTILVKISDSLKETAKGKGIVSRLEADHFAVCIPEKHIHISALTSMIESFPASFQFDYEFRLAVGIYRIDDINTPVDVMCDRAKLALNSIKDDYKRSFAFYNEQMKDTMLREEMFKSSLKKAMDKGQIVLYVQPKIDLSTDKIMGGEVLVRWNHPKEGIIPPLEYIPLFESNGQIIDLDFYICEKTMQTMQDWQNRGIDLPLSINFSRRSLANRTSVDRILALSKKYGLKQSNVRLEITESAFVQNSGSLAADLKRLQNEGFLILIDDFGSGYSSFSMLKDAPVDCIKLDMQFLSGEDTFGRLNGIISSILHMCREIKLAVVAEGVETQVQADLLKANGCEYAQGYYYSKPIPIAEFEKLLE